MEKLNSIESVFSQIHKTIIEKAHQKIEDETQKYYEALRYQIGLMVSEMASGKSNLYDSDNATVAEKKFAENPYSVIDIKILDVVQNDNAICKRISLSFKPGMESTSNINSAIYLANSNMKKIFGKDGGNNVMD